MVRHRKRIVEKDEDYDWPFEISIKLKKTTKKIAFLSGCPRECYPEDCGYSKFGIEYGLPDPEAPNCNYKPNDGNRLAKPVSGLGYGIGGLSKHPRFPKSNKANYPAPNIYQDYVIPPRLVKVKRAEKTKWKEFVEKYEKIAVERVRMIDIKEGRRSQLGIKEKKFVEPKHEVLFRNEGKWCPSAGRIQGFGMGVHETRFQKEPAWDLHPAVGTYDPEIPSKTSWQITTPEGVLVPRVRLICLPGSCDLCMRCGGELFASDYYQTKRKYKVRNRMEEDMATHKLVHLSLCKRCYCHALSHDGHGPWKKERIPEIFMKARHCNSVHDHQQGLPEHVARARCKDVNYLSRKELVFGRYFKDAPCKRGLW